MVSGSIGCKDLLHSLYMPSRRHEGTGVFFFLIFGVQDLPFKFLISFMNQSSAVRFKALFVHVLPNSLSLKPFLLQLACNDDTKTAVLRQPTICGAVCVYALGIYTG